MPKTDVLKQNCEFHHCYGRGKSKASPLLVTYAVKNRGYGVRFGITTTKKLGTAVERNRCRRIIRAAFSSLRNECSGNYDIVFVARHKTKNSKSTLIAQDMRLQLISLNVIKGSQN